MKKRLLLFVLFLCLMFAGCNTQSTYTKQEDISTDVAQTSLPEAQQDEEQEEEEEPAQESKPEATKSTYTEENIPAYDGEPYVTLNKNKPKFPSKNKTKKSFEKYSEQDSLGRCQVAYANICKELMPTEERGGIGQVRPSGWHTVKYDCVDGKYLYNRAHLIGFQLAGENANEDNLITGTRYMNMQGMLPFENEVADYVKETGNHVLYRVTPVYKGDNLVATGVKMEAYSVEDDGDGVCFNVFVYNVQPGVVIDYKTGESRLETNQESEKEEKKDKKDETSQTYILNRNTHKFHIPSCRGVGQMKSRNKETFTGTKDELAARGYDPCGMCNP